MICIFTSIWFNLFSKALMTPAKTIGGFKYWYDWKTRYTLANMVVVSLKSVIRSIISIDGWFIGSGSRFRLDTRGVKAIDDDQEEGFVASILIPGISLSSTWNTKKFSSWATSRFSAAHYWWNLTALSIFLTTFSICLANCSTAILKLSRLTLVPDFICSFTNSSIRIFTYWVTVCIG